MKNNKFIKFIFKYKVVIIIAFIFSAIEYLNPVDYKNEYDSKLGEVQVLSNKINEIKKDNSLDKVNSEIVKLESNKDKLTDKLNSKNKEIEKVKEEKLKIEQAKKKAEEVKKKAEEKHKKEEKNEQIFAESNNENNLSQEQNQNSEKENKPKSTSNKVTSNSSSVSNSANELNNSTEIGGNFVYANGGSSSSDKYHKSPNAHGMKDAIKMTESDAKKSDYKACKICYR